MHNKKGEVMSTLVKILTVFAVGAVILMFLMINAESVGGIGKQIANLLHLP